MKPSKKSSSSSSKKKPKPKPIPQTSSSSSHQQEQQQQEEEEQEELLSEAQSLTWLTDAFSTLTLSQVTSALLSAGGDPYKAAGILGSHFEPESDFDLDEYTETTTTVVPTKKKRRRKKNKKKAAAASGMVSNVIGKGYTQVNTSSSSSKEEESRRRYSGEEAEEFLCSMLGDNSELNMGVVRDVLGQCGFDVEKALDALLDISATCYNQFMERDSGEFIRNSVGSSCTYPEISSNGLSENTLTDRTPDSRYVPSEIEHDILQYVEHGCSEYSEALVDTKEQPPTRSEIVDHDVQQKVLKSLFNIPDISKYESSRMDWKKVVKQMKSFGQGWEYQFANTAEPVLNSKNAKGNDYQMCRSVARKHWDTMKTHYQRAALAYSRGERDHAAHLSEMGKIQSKLAREADERASREIFEARNKDIRNTVTIDLHGQHVKQAIRFLKLHLLLFTYIPSIQFLKVITGRGLNGVGKGILKRSVIGLVKKEGIEWHEENAGTLLLHLEGLKEYSFIEEDSDSGSG